MTQGKSYTILNVDDSEAGRYAKTRILQRAGYRVAEAATGETALELVRALHPELVLLDITLPDINGLDVCRAIKDDPATADTMVLQISAVRVTGTDRVQALSAGADSFLAEPVEADELVASVRALLRLYERERENSRLVAELTAREAQLSVFFESTSVGMAQADPFTGCIVRVNTPFCEMLGYRKEELLGRAFAEVTHPEDRESNMSDFLRLSRGEIDECRCDKRYVRRDGSVVWADVTINLLRDGEGTPSRTVAVVRDIAARKQAEAALRESEERFRRLADLMPQIVFTADGSGRVDFVNRQWTEYTGENEEAALSEHWDEQIHPDDRERTRLLWRESVESGTPHETEFRLRGRDGVYRWNLSRGVPATDQHGQVIGWFGTCTDIDSSKRLHDALRESEERLRLAVEAARFGTYDVDIEKDRIHCSRELREICGLAPDDRPLDTEACIALIHPVDREATVAEIRRALSPEGAGRYQVEFRIVRPDGSVRRVVTRGRGFFTGEGQQRCALRVLGTVNDITIRWRNEEQLRKQNERLELLAKTAARLLTAGDPSGMLEEAFATVEEHLGIDAYLSYSIEQDGTALVLEGMAGIPDEVAAACRRLELGQALCGTVAQTRNPIIAERLQQSTDPKAELAKRSGLNAYVCFPLIVGDRLLGTLSFASKHRERFDDDEVEFIRTICHYVAMTKERLRLLSEARRQAAELAQSELRLQLALDTASVGIYEWDLRNIGAIWDERLRSHWGVRTGAPLTYDMFMGGIHAEDRSRLQAAMEGAFDPAGHSTFSCEFRVIGLDDGQERWIATRGRVFHDHDRPSRLLGTTLDITNRKRAEVELLALRDRLALELADMTRLHELSTTLLNEDDLEPMLDKVLSACMELLGADKGNVQLFDETQEIFEFGAQRGFDRKFLEHFKKRPRELASTWRIALKESRRVIVEDLSKQPGLAELAGILAEQNVRALQTTPIFGHEGKVLGMLSTHFGEPHRPSERELRLLDLYTQQAVRVIERKRSELTRAQLAAIVESSDDAIYSTDTAGVITSWNRGAEKLFGYVAAEALGQHVRMLLPSERAEEDLASHQRVATGEAVANYETVRRRKDGSDVLVSVTLSPIRDAQGTVIGVSKVARDIGARILAEETLWRSEQQLSLAQNAAHVGIWDWDPRTRRLAWTAEMSNLYGVTHSAQTYDEWRELVHTDDLERIEAERNGAIRRREPFNVEYRIMHGSGEIRWVASRGQGWYSDDGELVRVLGINMDVTERKRAEERLRESEERFRALADSAPVLIWINDHEGTRFCNRAYREFVGVTDEAELTGSGWAQHLHPADRDDVVSTYEKAREGRERFEIDFRLRRADGEYRWMKTLATPRFTENGSFLGYAGCTVDIHDAKMAQAEAALLAALVNSSLDAIYSFTLDYKIASWNHAAELLFGWSETEMVGETTERLFPPELMEERDALAELVLRGEAVTRFETVRLRRDGSRFDVSLTLSPVIAQGKTVAVSVVARDITESKRAQEQREQQARLLDLSLDAIIVRDRAGGSVEYWNQGAEKLYGYAASEAVGRALDELLETAYPAPAAVQKRIDAVGEWDGRVVHRQKSGERIAVLSRMQRIARPGGDMILEVNRDITSVEEAEQAVAEAAAHLKAIVDNAVDGIVTIDAHGAIESLNPAAEKIFGYAAAEVLGRDVALLMPELSKHFGEGQLAHYLRTVDRKTTGSVQETYGRRKDGSEFPIEFGVSETVVGKSRFYTGVVRDATARKEAERALVEAKNAADAANRAKSEFLANMSHEIRNPMTGIMGYADILLARLQDRNAIECVRTIKDSGHYLLQIINDLLDLAKIEAQGLELEKAPVHLPTFLADVYTLMEGAARSKALPLALKYDGGIPYQIESDPKRLRQILINLLGNAIKFTERGGVELAVRFDAAEARLQFDVADSGIGMSQEQQQNLFKPFSQGDSSMTKSYGGTGLGLAITKRLVEALGGEIRVESLPGHGSTFRVTLPVRVLSGSAYRGTEVDSEAPSSGPARRLDAHVMIVEDQPDIRRLMEHFIVAAGGTVKAFGGGEEALAAIQETSRDFDLILMDIQMPRMDGYETTRRIRGLGFTGPIIAVTAGAMPSDRDNCLAAGCTEYVSKPIDMNLLLDKIACLAASHRASAYEKERREPALWDDTSFNSGLEADGGLRCPNRRVLVVDDRPVALNATKTLLEMHDFDVRGAPTGQAALRIAEEFQPDFIFLDISLPDISGYEVFRRLKSRQQLAHTKFIAISGHGREESLRARRAGFDAYMSKPIDIREMERLMTGPAEAQRSETRE